MPDVDFANPGVDEDDLKAALRALLPYRGVMVYASADDVGVNISTTPTKSWDSEAHDTSGFHDLVTNPERITIPANVSKVRLNGMLEIEANQTAGSLQTAMVRKWDGATLTSNFDGRGYSETYSNSAGGWRVQSFSALLEVTPGDQFGFGVFSGDASVDVSNRCFFCLEVLE